MFTRALPFFLFVFLLAACATPPANIPPPPTLSPQAAQGKTIFSRECGSCHSTSADTIIVGPTLAGVAGRATTRVAGQDARTYLYTAVLEPGDYLVDGYENLMPATFGKTLTGEELDAVIAFLQTLQ